MTISSLVLSDGTTTLTLTDGTNYALAKSGWAPAVARLRMDGLESGYEDVDEEITIDVMGSNLATLLTNEREMHRLLEQARRFGGGDLTVSPVTLQITMTGSTVKSSCVLDGWYERPSSFVDLAAVNEIAGGTIRLRRKGLWLAAAESAAVTSSVATGVVASATFSPSHPIPSPVTVTWNMPTLVASSAYDVEQQLLICSDAAADIIVIDCGAASSIRFSGTSEFNSTAVTDSLGGYVLRLNPTAANTEYTSTDYGSVPSGLNNPGLYAIFAMGYATQQAQIKFSAYLNTANRIDTGWYTFPVSTLSIAAPHLIGILAVPPTAPIQLVNLIGRGPTTGNQVFIDYMVAVPLSPDVTILGIEAQQPYSLVWSTNTIEQRVDPQYNTALSPVVQIGRTTGAQRAALGHQGQATIWTKGTNLSLIWLAANKNNLGAGAFNGTYRIAATGPVLHATTFSCVRQRGYLVPE